jgi:hypothetical protein
MENRREYPNGRTGWGLINLTNTLFLSGARRRLFVEDLRNSSGLGTGDTRQHVISVDSTSEPLKVTLVWTDPPAESAAGRALVNDLNLTVIAPNGTDVYRGNANFVNGSSQPQMNTASPDPNNVEMVIVERPAVGRWTVQVNGNRVAVGHQGYALVVTGSLGDRRRGLSDRRSEGCLINLLQTIAEHLKRIVIR